jgi:hypothetical protein
MTLVLQVIPIQTINHLKKRRKVRKNTTAQEQFQIGRYIRYRLFREYAYLIRKTVDE